MISEEQLDKYRKKLALLQKMNNDSPCYDEDLLNSEYPELVTNLIKELQEIIDDLKYDRSM